MCGCRGLRPNKAIPAAPLDLFKPTSLALVSVTTPEPVYGCFTGTRYPFNLENPLYVDRRDVECMSVEHSIDGSPI